MTLTLTLSLPDIGTDTDTDPGTDTDTDPGTDTEIDTKLTLTPTWKWARTRTV